MGRKAGVLVACRCATCGAVEMHPGCTSGFQCIGCRPVQRRDDPKYLAHRAVARAIRAGQLRPIKDCMCVDCGAQAEHYEHRDYSKPLQVEPTCRRCNFRRGPAAGSDVRSVHAANSFA